MGRLCFLEEITDTEMIFSTRGETVRIPIGDISTDYFREQLAAGETVLLEVDLEEKKLVDFEDQVKNHEREIENSALLRADDSHEEA